MIVTKDDDLAKLGFLRGAPPKVVWLVMANAGTEHVADLLERQQSAIAKFAADAPESVLILRLARS